MKLCCLAVNHKKEKGSCFLFSSLVGGSFQEIVLAHCGFKPRIAASLSWSYTATSVQTKHRHTSQRLPLVRYRKWSGNLIPSIPSMFAPARKSRISCAVKSMRKTCGGWGTKASYFSLACSIFATWYRLRNTDKLSIYLHHRESLALSRTRPSRIMFRSSSYFKAQNQT